MKEPILYRILRPLIKLFMKIVYHPKYIGLENIPESGRFVLASNHTNNMDCVLLISSTKRTIHFLAKDSLMQGAKKILFKNMGIIPVNRSIHDGGALLLAERALEQNQVIGIFPEGTINRTDDIIMKFKIGAVKMAYDTNAYIIPVTIKGEYKPFKNDLTIEFLPPFKPYGEDLKDANQELMDKISSNLQEKR